MFNIILINNLFHKIVSFTFSYINSTSKINQCLDSMNNTCKFWDYDHSRYLSTIVTEVNSNN